MDGHTLHALLPHTPVILHTHTPAWSHLLHICIRQLLDGVLQVLLHILGETLHLVNLCVYMYVWPHI